MDPNQATQSSTPAEPLSEPSTEAVLRDIAKLRAELSASDKASIAVAPPPPSVEPAPMPQPVSPPPAPKMAPPPPQPEPALPKQPLVAPLPPSVSLPKPPGGLPLPEKLLTPPPPAHQQKTPWGEIIGIVIIIAILIVGALYVWGAKLAQEDATRLNPKTPPTADVPEEPAGDTAAPLVDAANGTEETAGPVTPAKKSAAPLKTSTDTVTLPLTTDGFMPETDSAAAQ